MLQTGFAVFSLTSMLTVVAVLLKLSAFSTIEFYLLIESKKS